VTPLDELFNHSNQPATTKTIVAIAPVNPMTWLGLIRSLKMTLAKPMVVTGYSELSTDARLR